MKIAVIDSNIFWTRRLQKSIEALGHECVIQLKPSGLIEGDVVILNLSEENFDVFEIIKIFRDNGVPVIAHVGHKEKELIKRGYASGADIVSSNGEITFHIEKLLEQVHVAG